MSTLGVLADYFRDPSKARRALQRYGEFAHERNWTLRESKYEMYEAAKTAFGDSETEASKREGFSTIYGQLRRYWQVFRGGNAYWDQEKTFAVMKQCQACSRASPVTLEVLSEDSLSAVARCLYLMRGIKKTQWFPVMPVAKFLHFFNPRLFPIYDTSVIRNEVLKTFQHEW